MIDGFGAKLKKHRVAAGMTQAQLAELSGVRRKQISDFEMEVQRNPKGETLSKLANAFKISIEELLSDEDAITGKISVPSKNNQDD
ncbi:helix-turn-helix domain-containing protein, partial [Acinetobacter baumannii]|nr:helix-turn-helix domain-containing protein [Acinetobacter baumannii]